MDKKPKCIFCGSTENLSPIEPVDYEIGVVYICDECRNDPNLLDRVKSFQQTDPVEPQQEDLEDHENPKP